MTPRVWYTLGMISKTQSGAGLGWGVSEVVGVVGAVEVVKEVGKLLEEVNVSKEWWLTVLDLILSPPERVSVSVSMPQGGEGCTQCVNPIPTRRRRTVLPQR